MIEIKSSEKYQVYFFTCPAHKPVHFAVHPWVVSVCDGQVNRWEIIHKKYDDKERSGFVYKNFYRDPFQGIKKSENSQEFWDSRLIGSVLGDENSLAHKIVNFIEKESFSYPHKERYILFPGPNSNTYIQWILNKFPETNIKLPWNAFGKMYK